MNLITIENVSKSYNAYSGDVINIFSDLKIKTITSANTLKWTDSGHKKGVKYCYKIRAYCKVNGKTTYGNYSSVYEKQWHKYRMHKGRRQIRA
mgnify:CR=1 FL=1